jgi:hypothetical protein
MQIHLLTIDTYCFRWYRYRYRLRRNNGYIAILRDALPVVLSRCLRLFIYQPMLAFMSATTSSTRIISIFYTRYIIKK